MAYRTIDRTASGIVFFGPTPADQTFESNSNFRIDTGNNRAIISNITLADSGWIGSATRTGILNLGADGFATFSSGVIVRGNLIVEGVTTTVNSNEVNIGDSIILLNSDETGVPSQHAGLEIERGSSTNVQFRWNETSDFWEFTNDGSTYFDIASRTGNQTFFNKTISGASNTLTNIGNISLVNSSVTVNAGSGLVHGGLVSLGGSITVDVGAGPGITLSADAVTVKANSGILVTADGVAANLINYTAQTTAANPATTNASRTYAVQVDTSDKLVVNVPWTDTGMSFTISDGTNTQTIVHSDTLRFQSGAAINFTVSATDTVSGTLNAAVAGVGLSMTNQVLAVDFSEFSAIAVASGDSFATLDSDGTTEQRTTVSNLGTYFAGAGLIPDGSGVIAVGAGNGITVAADSVAVNYDDSTIGLVAGKVAVKGSGITNLQVNPSVISGQTEITTIDGTLDYLLVWDATDSALKRVNRANFVTGLGSMSSFTLSADAGPDQTISDGNTLEIAGGSGILTLAAGTDTVTIHLDISEYSSVAVASGDRFLTLDSNGSTEQLTTVSDLGLFLAGTNITVGGDGKHSVTNATIEGVVFAAGNFVDSSRIDFTVTAGDSVTADIIAGSVSPTYLSSTVGGSGLFLAGDGLHIDLNEYSSVAVASGDRLFTLDSNAATEQLTTVTDLGNYFAGAGIISDGGGVHAVNTDGSTLEVNADIVRIKDNGVTDPKLRQSAGLSVIGRSANTTGNVADITALTDGHVLKRNGTSLVFGFITAANLSRSVVTISNTGTALVANACDIVIMSAATLAASATLPAPSAGAIIVFKRTDSSTNTCTINRNAAETIDGAVSIQLYYQYESVTLVSDGTNWFVV